MIIVESRDIALLAGHRYRADLNLARIRGGNKTEVVLALVFDPVHRLIGGTYQFLGGGAVVGIE